MPTSSSLTTRIATLELFLCEFNTFLRLFTIIQQPKYIMTKTCFSHRFLFQAETGVKKPPKEHKMPLLSKFWFVKDQGLAKAKISSDQEVLNKSSDSAGDIAKFMGICDDKVQPEPSKVAREKK